MGKQHGWNVLFVFYKVLVLVPISISESAPVLATNRRVPVEGVSFSFNCTLDADIISTARFFKTDAIKGGCSSSGSCGTPVQGYTVSVDNTSRILTLDIASANSTRDSGTWICNDGATGSNSITLSQFAETYSTDFDADLDTAFIDYVSYTSATRNKTHSRYSGGMSVSIQQEFAEQFKRIYSEWLNSVLFYVKTNSTVHKLIVGFIYIHPEGSPVYEES